MKLIILLFYFFSVTAYSLETGTRAPDFSLEAVNSKNPIISLSDFKNKIVVLEWLNHGCPFVRKHYDSGNMQKLQKEYTQKDIIWLSVISSAPGKQGHVDKTGALKDKMDKKSFATDILLDKEGKVGQLYGAKTTPHIYIIDKNGTLVYQGAIDDQPDTDLKSIPVAKNYVSKALEELITGKKIINHTTKSYGCSVKY